MGSKYRVGQMYINSAKRPNNNARITDVGASAIRAARSPSVDADEHYTLYKRDSGSFHGVSGLVAGMVHKHCHYHNKILVMPDAAIMFDFENYGYPRLIECADNGSVASVTECERNGKPMMEEELLTVIFLAVVAEKQAHRANRETVGLRERLLDKLKK